MFLKSKFIFINCKKNNIKSYIMKKSNFLSKTGQRISREELRKIGGGIGSGCPRCGSPFLDSGNGQCFFAGPNGQLCPGFIRGNQCCLR